MLTAILILVAGLVVVKLVLSAQQRTDREEDRRTDELVTQVDETIRKSREARKARG